MPGTETELLGQLLTRARAGQADAWNDVFRLVEGRLLQVVQQRFSISRSRVSRWMESSDVAQELRVKLMADLSRRTPESMAHLFNIMSLVLKRLLIDLDRSLFGREGMGAHYRSYGGDADSAGGPVFNDIASDEDDQAHPTDGLQYAEVLQLLDRLPKEQREAAQLYYLWDLTNEQVAEQLGVSTGKASGLISEARKALFRMYEGQTP